MVPTVDIAFIAAELDRLADEIERALEDRSEDVEPRFGVLRAGLQTLLSRLRSAEADSLAVSAIALRSVTGNAPDALLTHGMDLLSQLAALAGRLHLPRVALGVEELALPLACWLIRRGAELHRPEPAVNAAAALANVLHDPDALADLYALMREIVDGFSPQRIQEAAAGDPTHPWRVLLLERASVATRSLRPALMVEAFDLLGDQFPDVAPDFFREGMGQMEAQGYPQPVRETMERYYVRWSARQRLH